MINNFYRVPWDSRALGFYAYEIRQVSEEALQYAETVKGHLTARVDPLADKKILHEHGFYYCDTLIEPYCLKQDFMYFNNDKLKVCKSDNNDIDQLYHISLTSFKYDRFHRDFNIEKSIADLRYAFWLEELHKNENVLSLYHGKELAGFFAHVNNKVALTALKQEYRGKGLAKCFWSLAYSMIFKMGFNEAISSVSAANTAILNVYTRLGFKFRNPKDIYHKVNL
jgi:ribosomal protein S18 acetylase RimI-like enzyme